jgi:long-chain acyl-CoA synthetase
MEYRFNNFYEIIAHHSKKRRKKTALLVDDEKISYGDVLDRSDRLAAFLASKGIGKGDKVALFLRNCPEFIYTVFAVSKLGAIVVPVNTFLKSDELDYILQDSGAKMLVASLVHEKVVDSSHASTLCGWILWEGEAFKEKGEQHLAFKEAVSVSSKVEPASYALDECAVIIYTSGTTGNPKGAMLSNRNILSNVMAGAERVRFTPRDRDIVFLPMFHSFTFSIATLLPLHQGGSIVIIKSLKPFSNIFKQILTKRVTIFLGVPDVYNALAKAKLPWYFMWFHRLRLFISGAAPLQPKTIRGMKRKFKRAILAEGYGLSEASPAVSINPLNKQKDGSVGIALKSYSVKIVDEEMNELPRGAVGDIIVKGDNVMMGYHNRPEATAETIVNGWLLTGDMGYMDEEDYLYIVDRKKDLIISKGINIYPREIENRIDQFDGIKASAVIGIPDEHSGEIPVAYLELEEEVESIDTALLRGYLREHLANYKIPKHYHVIDELPKNATGKVLKRVLKEKIKSQNDV